jgi:hypothetical protein
MCRLIVDVNVATRVLVASNDPQFDSLHRSLFGTRRPNPVLVYGGHLTVEYRRNNTLTRILRELDRAGRAEAASDIDVDAEAGRLRDGGTLNSDDPHILALARVSGARLLCSEDKALRGDFKNKAILDPRGKLYSKASHRRVLTHNC